MALKKLVPFIFYLSLFGFGFYVRDLIQDRENLKQAQAEKIEINRKIDISQKNGNELESELKKAKEHENKIISNAIKTNNRYHDNSDCFDDDFIKLFNEQSSDYERILSIEYDARMFKNIADDRKK